MNNVKVNVVYGMAIAGAIVGLIGQKKQNTLLTHVSGLIGWTGVGMCLGEIVDYFAG